MRALWDQLTSRIDLIEASAATLAIEPGVLEAVTQAFGKAFEQYERTEEVAGNAADLNTLIERAVFVTRRWQTLAEALQALASSCASSFRRRSTGSARSTIGRSSPVSRSAGWLCCCSWLSPGATCAVWRVRSGRLQEGATRIGRGDLTSRIDVRTGDELQSLAEHFNQMAGQLQESYANLEGKVEERTQQLARSVSELEALGEVSRAVNSLARARDRAGAHPGARLHARGCRRRRHLHRGGRSRHFRIAATHGMDEDLVRAIRGLQVRMGDTVVGQCAARREPVQIVDLAAEPDYPLYAALMKAGMRALLGVPLLREGEVIGALIVRRKRVGAFAEETVELVKSFAAQSVARRPQRPPVPRDRAESRASWRRRAGTSPSSSPT